MSLAVQLVRRQAYLDQLAENAGRVARVILTFDTTGEGELLVQRALGFELVFSREPAITTGVALTAGRLVKGKFPNVSAGVWKWDRSSKGYYTGAFLFFVCDSGGQPYRLRHTVTFEGDAIKVVAKGLLT
jgi:hypothetical protein